MAQRLLRKSTIKVAEALQMTLMEHANLRKTLVCAEGILMALFDQNDSIIEKIVAEIDRDIESIRYEVSDRVLQIMNQLPERNQEGLSQLQMSEDVNNLFEAADKIARQLGDAFVSTGTLFLGFFDNGVPGGQKILNAIGLDFKSCFDALVQIRGNSKINERDSESRISIMQEYTTDLTQLARRGKLDPVVGRDLEIEKVIQVLSRRKKNNPLLLGEPGVGKTVIVEGLANRIAQADVPEFLLNRKVYSLEMGSLLAGAKMQGEFEERLKAIRDEVIGSAGDIILFIDEVHTVVGAGKSQGSLDASNMLKPALATGQLQCIGATTLSEYKKYIEIDKALDRRFRLIRVEEPSTSATIEILSRIKTKYEEHHEIEYTNDAIKAAAELSSRYIPDRYLPDKAIDLIDEAGARQRLKVIYTPPSIRKIERSRQKYLDLKSQAFNEQDFESMAKYQMELSQIEADLAREKAVVTSNSKLVDRFVDREDIADLVSKSTGIPVKKIVAEEAKKLLDLESLLEKRVIGQKHVIVAVSDAIRRNRSGLRKVDSPIASFLFLGPTGVGKTELAKAIASEVLDDENRIVRIDMSEYMERHDVSKLIGSPPGYVGYGQGGQLTEAIRNQPYSVVLFDEFEKAHKDVFNLLLQVLDEGWLTDSEGRKVIFRNCIIIGTSNLGSEVMVKKKNTLGIGSQVEAWSKDDQCREIFKIVRKHFLPEFLNRIDEIVVFNKLTTENMEEILEVFLNSLTDRLKKLNCGITFTPESKIFLLEKTKSTDYGARPMKRTIEQFIENKIASLLIDDLSEGQKQFVVHCIDNSISIEVIKIPSEKFV